MANWKTKDSVLNDSKLSLTSICSKFLLEFNFDSLGLFVNIGTVPHFQRIYYLSQELQWESLK